MLKNLNPNIAIILSTLLWGTWWYPLRLMNEIANNNSLSIKTINNAERTFDTVKDDLARNEIIAKAFSSNKDFVSDMEDINNSQSIIINVDNILFEKPYELNEVFEKVSDDWIKSLLF